MKRSISIILALCLLAALFVLPASADNVEVNVVSRAGTIVSETTVYAGEIRMDGESVIRYLWSDEITRNETVLAALKDALCGMDNNVFGELVPAVVGEDGVGIAACSNAEYAAAMDESWKNAFNVAGLYYPELTVSNTINVDLFGYDEGYTAYCSNVFADTEDADIELFDAEGETYSIHGPLGKLTTSLTDSVTYTVIDGQLVKLIDREIDYTFESVTVIYTCAEFHSEAHLHIPMHVEAVPATCTEPGCAEYWACACGMCWADEAMTKEIDPADAVIPALGHDLVTDPAKPATCTEAGLTEGQHCTRCDYKVAQEEIAALGHDWDSGKVTTPATATSDGVKTFVCNRCGATQTEIIPAAGVGQSNPFSDVKEGDFFYDAVLWAVNADPQVTSGTSKTTFSPSDTCTRAQVVTFLWRAKGCPEPKSSNNPFSDVREGEYYYKAVLWAVENEITAGTSKTTFSPNAGCTRAQVVTFLWRTEGQPKPTSSANPFTDVKGGYYYDAVLWAVEKNITAGTSATTFSPDNTCTRGQIVTFLYRAFAG